MKRAFTLLEIIMVIVIMGIISAIGADIISTMYTNYLQSKAVNYLQSQSDTALQLISKRLSHRIRGSEAVIRGANIAPLSAQADTDTILTWIGVSSESQKGQWNAGVARFVPGWSGLIDFDHPNTRTATRSIVSPGSHLAGANAIIQALTNNDASLTKGNVAFIPKTSKATDVTDYYNNTNTNYTLSVTGAANTYVYDAADGLPNYPSGDDGITNQYYLSHTAYALVLTGTAPDMNLSLHYNYRPWDGEAYNSNNTAVNIVAEHVSTFRFLRYGGAIRIKLCLQDANLNTSNALSACKETVVF